jgi:DNA polymerase III subunit chi
MTQVDFHIGVDDPLHYTCRLLRKAFRQGARVAVTAPPPVLQSLDRALWVFDERDFIPHLRLSAGRPAPALATRTPLWLVEGPLPSGAPDVLVNLDADEPADATALSRIIEIVGDDPEQIARGRDRWRSYLRQGLAPRKMPDKPAAG